MLPLRLLVVLAMGFVVPSPSASAQFVEEDDKLKDHAEQDAAYLERIRQEESRPARPSNPEEARKQFLERANELVRDRNFTVAEDARFVVRTDDPRLEPEAILVLLNSFAEFFREQWQGSWENYTLETEQTPVFMYFSYAKYNQLLDGDFSRSLLRPKGHYADDLGALVMHSDADAPGDSPDTLIHELAHRLAARQLGIGHRTAPPWVSEGLAGYYGFMLRDKDGTISASEIGGKGVAFYRDGRPEKPRDSFSRLQRFRRLQRAAIRKQEPLVERVVRTAEPAEFYAGDVILSYTVGWILFHYLMHGEEGALRAPFVRWLASQDPDPGSLYTALEIEPAELEQRLADYAGSL